MVAAIACWRTMTGIIRTSSLDTLDVSIEAFTDLNPSGEGGIDHVDFSVTVNGGAPSVTTVSSLSIRYPNFNNAASPIAGSRDGTMAPFAGYGITLDCDTLDAGRIEVTATVYSTAGTATAVDFPTSSIVLYNNKDGSIVHPSTAVIYVGSSGWPGASDSNAGTDIAAPKATVRAGIGTGNLANKTVVLLPGTHYLLGPYSSGNIYTSDHYWCNLLALPGVVFKRDDPDFILYVDGNGVGSHARFRFLGDPFWHDDGMAFYIANSDVRVHAWLDGGFSGSANYDPAKPYTVLYGRRGFTGPLDADGSVTRLYRYATCHTRLGVTFGLNAWNYLHDNVIKHVQGVCHASATPGPRDAFLHCLVDGHRYAEKDVRGFIDLRPSGSCVLTVPAPGQLQLTATSTTTLFNTGETFTLNEQLEDLVGSGDWSLLFENFTNPGNNGTFPVLSVGTVGSFPYVIVSCPAGVAEFPPSAARIRTCTSAGTLYTTVIHTDILQIQNGRTDCIWSGMAARDAHNLRGFVDEGGTLTRCVLFNCNDGANDGRNNDWGANLINCLFIHNNFHHWNFSSSASFTGANFVDNVCDHATNFPASGYRTNNHFVTGSTGGSNATTGEWFAGDPTVAPYDSTPLEDNLDTASGLLPAPSAWWWEGATADTRGVWKPLGTFNWSEGTGVEVGAWPSVTVTGAELDAIVTPTVTTDSWTGVTVTGAEVDAVVPSIPSGSGATVSTVTGDGSSRGRGRPQVPKRGNPLRELPTPRGTGFTLLPKFWRSRP